MVDEVRFLNQRFGNVIIAKIGKEGEDNIPIKVDQFYGGGSKGSIILRYGNVNGEEREDTPFKPDDYILDCPRVGMVFAEKRTVYLTRIPDRQWKRGYNGNIIRLEYLCSSEVREMGYRLLNRMETKIVKFVYNPEYIDFNVGMDKLLNNKLFNFPISMKYAVGITSKYKYPIVFYKSWQVGWVDGGVVFLPKETHHLFEELSQYAECRRVE